MALVWNPQFHSISSQPSICGWKHGISSNILEHRRELGLSYSRYNWVQQRTARSFLFRALSKSANSDEDKVVKTETEINGWKNSIGKLQETIKSFPPVVFVMKKDVGINFAIRLCVATTILVVAIRVYVARKVSSSRPGSVADLVRRGQLRSDRRGISSPLKYEDPFNNPLVKVGKSNSTVEMCGKVYRLAPVTLTKEQQAIHQKRRSRAYQWKRPTMFLKEGDSIPSDVDPDTVRWIPANHPFATTASEIDEGLAQNNVYQKHGVPFRIQAEHEALQRKLEALQSEQKLNKLVIDPTNAKDFERPFKHLKSQEQAGQGPSNRIGSDSSPEEMQKP